MMIDRYMPAFHLSRRHETRVCAPPDVVYRAIRHLDFSRSRLLRLLFRLRGMPSSVASMDAFAGDGMLLLEERPNVEFILGVIGRFWRTKRVELHPFDPVEFRSYRPQGYAKAVWHFRVDRGDGSCCTLSTETRVYCPDNVTRRMFRLYWLFAGPMSGLVRWLLLDLARHDAEARIGALKKSA